MQAWQLTFLFLKIYYLRVSNIECIERREVNTNKVRERLQYNILKSYDIRVHSNFFHLFDVLVVTVSIQAMDKISVYYYSYY